MRIIRGLLWVSAMCVFACASASAQGLTGKIGVASIVGASMPIQYLKSDDGGGNAKLGFSAGASGEYFVNEDLSVGGRFMFDKFGVDVEGDGSGSWTMIEFGVFGRYQFMPGQPTRPYGRAGLLMGSAKAKSENGVETEASIGMSPGVELAGGVIHQLQPNLSLFGELGWTALATDGKDVDVTVDGEDVGTFESEKHLQWIGLKVGVIFLLGGAAE
jgi:hypothetical protein